MIDLFPYLVSLTFAFIGLFVSLYIFYTKNLLKSKHVYCPIGGRCEGVLNSKYSKFLGIENVHLGILYYIFIIVFYSYFLMNPLYVDANLVFLAIGFNLVALSFSVYLLFIQTFTLKEFCSLCIITLISNLVIFIDTIFGSHVDIIPVLSDYKIYILLLHNIGVVLGLGGAVVADYLFFKFLKDYKISETEASVLDFVSQLIWLGLGLLYLSGLGLYLPQAETLNESGRFLLKFVVVLIITINGIVLHLVVTPRLEHIRFDTKKHRRGYMKMFRRLAFTTGAISFVSWWTSFFLGSLRNVSFTFTAGFIIYLIIVVGAIIGSQLVEHNFSKKPKL